MNRTPPFNAPQRVCLIKPSALGDVVTAMGVLRGLKRTFPGVHVSWLINSNCADLIAHDTDVDELILFDRKLLGKAWRNVPAAGKLIAFLRHLRKGRFDWVIDMQGLFRSGFFTMASRAGIRAGFADARELASLFYNVNFRSPPTATHTVDRNIALARHLGIDARPDDMTLQIEPGAMKFWQDSMQANRLADKQYVVCVPPTRWKSKMYPKRHWRHVITGLLGRTKVVLIGTNGDREICGDIAEGLGENIVDMTGQTTIPQMVAVIAASAGVICCDSSAALIAPAVGVDAVSLIGPTRVERTGPYGGCAIVSPAACGGCLKRECKHTSCMEMISPDDVLNAGLKMFENCCNRAGYCDAC